MGLQRRLSVRIALAVGAVALIGAGLVSTMAYLSTQSSELLESRRILYQLCQTVQRTATIAAYLDNQEIASETIQGLASNETVAAVSLTSVSGLSATRGLPQSQNQGDAVRLELESPFNAGEVIGELAVYPRQDLIELNARSAAVERASLLGGYTLSVALLVTILVQWQFVPGLRQLTEALRGVRPGSGERLGPPAGHGSDEIGRLVGDINGLLDLVQDKMAGEQALRDEIQGLEQRLRMIFERASVGIFLASGDGRIIMSNQAFGAILDGEDAASGRREGTALSEVFVESEEAAAMLEATARLGKSTDADLRLAGAAEDAQRWVHCLFTRIGGTPGSTIPGSVLVQGIITDVTERKRAELRMRLQTERDPLTGLLDRHAAERLLQTMIEESAGSRSGVAVCVIEIEGLAELGEARGSAGVDRALTWVAERLRGTLRRSDLAARVGEHAFMVAVLDQNCRTTIESVAAKLSTALGQEVELDGLAARALQVRMGIAVAGEHGADALPLLERAARAAAEARPNAPSGHPLL